MGSVSHNSYFDAAESVEPDGIFEVLRRYNADDSPDKINVCVGAYRDENGRPWVLPSVQMAKKKIAGADHEYLPMMGHRAFRDASVELLFHGSRALAERRIAGVQSLSGTGALLLAGMTLKKANTNIHNIYITSPTWPNHELLFDTMGFRVHWAPYYNNETRAYDHEAFLAALSAAEPNSAVVLHACAHNPTGCDPTREQWREIADVVRARAIFPIFDAAYLGFNSGSVDEDAWAVRHFIDDLGLEAAICLSFAKSMGLYGERVGAVLFVAAADSLAATIQSILENAQRATISTPPLYGASIAQAVLGSSDIRKQWAQDLITMSGRILKMRGRLFQELTRLGTPGSWEHVVKQTGMFGYLGIEPAQVVHLEKIHHVYMASTSRISIAGLNDNNVEYFAKALDATVRKFGSS
ncbi:hypothetical protein M406DRAFT_109085 [Cryphonectria parasitica EP155]|uniref:Aspartate aminotransferase n=1 Tax=Cryphonectria parasitica (strain ATCC 38755 / EP155) TaxID=660469 RepID=A0A9P5CN92_CRYP1|nr:uncharacterized protein M406DRAFT_109085 [Cryphonectria parasitica EP155]KAF3763896.1 hypothetical protein M406DRAFT_109085 [Cryphonectria parasitica EP155]